MHDDREKKASKKSKITAKPKSKASTTKRSQPKRKVVATKKASPKKSASKTKVQSKPKEFAKSLAVKEKVKTPIRRGPVKEYQFYNEIHRVGQGYDDQIVRGKIEKDETIPARGLNFGKNRDKARSREEQAEWESESEDKEFRKPSLVSDDDAAQFDDDDEEKWEEDAYEAGNEPDDEVDDYESTPKRKKR